MSEMNIFWTEHKVDNIAPTYHDRHVSQVQKWIARMVSTSLTERGVDHGSLYRPVAKGSRNEMFKWVDNSFGNMKRALSLLSALKNEWQYRFDRGNEVTEPYERMTEVVSDTDFGIRLAQNKATDDTPGRKYQVEDKVFGKSEVEETVPPRVGPARPDDYTDPENPPYTGVQIYYQFTYSMNHCFNDAGTQMTWTKRQVPMWISYWRESEYVRRNGSTEGFEPLGDKSFSQHRGDTLDSDTRGIK